MGHLPVFRFKESPSLVIHPSGSNHSYKHSRYHIFPWAILIYGMFSVIKSMFKPNDSYMGVSGGSHCHCVMQWLSQTKCHSWLLYMSYSHQVFDMLYVIMLTCHRQNCLHIISIASCEMASCPIMKQFNLDSTYRSKLV